MRKIKNVWMNLKTKKIKGSIMVETILILVVLIALVAIFKTQLTSLVGVVFEKITKTWFLPAQNPGGSGNSYIYIFLRLKYSSAICQPAGFPAGNL